MTGAQKVGEVIMNRSKNWEVRSMQIMLEMEKLGKNY